MFERKIFSLSIRKGSPEFQPTWEKDENNSALREKIMQRLQTYVVCTEDKIPIIPLWHGTAPGIEAKILSTGYASLEMTDPGFFGKGCFYGTPQSEYACRVYGRGVVILNFIGVGNIFPVTFEDMSKIFGKNCHKNYDCHYAPVVPKNKDNPDEVNYVGLSHDEDPIYDEFVLFQESQILPRFAVYFNKAV